MALLSEEFRKRGAKEPIIVGGLAVEIYTQGSYTTGDIDIKADITLLEEILKNWGFKKTGRVWLNDYLDIYIDWLGSSLEEGEEAEKRVNAVLIDENLNVKIISIEDLIIDRLNAYKWWKDEDSFLWAKILLKIKERMEEQIDLEYLKKRAKKEQIEDIVEKLLKK
ncbi:hypothetical protein THER_0445 [Thermodesulfovibrio sp. N1]|nr:DUF6036 family nucleotidyltransferase [Thermodesulfovibrio sp. N1]ODA44817.1 hypothetical protein THER_0445 [Thermodesulfovibrio sp. N1]